MEIGLRVPAHELQILGEGDVALDDAGAHACGRFVRFAGVFRELEGGATMADGEVGFLERPVAAAE